MLNSQAKKFSNVNANQSLDRRVQRTRKLLLDSFVELVQERGYEAVSVQDIIDRANVGRSTFYSHFENKEQLLFGGHNELYTQLFLPPTDAPGELTLGVNILRLFEHVAEHHQLARSMLGRKSGDLIIKHLQESLELAISRTLTRHSPPLDPVRSRLLAPALASMLTGLIRSWLEQDKSMATERVASLARQLLLSSLSV